MNPFDQRLRLDLAAARYLEALERGDFDAMAQVWQLARAEPELADVLRDVHAVLVEEQDRRDATAAASAVTEAVAAHLPSAEVVRPATGAVTVGDVAVELFRHTPDRLPAAAHALNELLRGSQDPLPADLGLSKLVTWAEAKFGTAPAEYWRAFRQAALRLELRRAAEAEYQLAARSVSPRPEDPK